MVHAIRSMPHVHLDINRIVGYATAIAMHVAVLLLLLAPLQIPVLAPADEGPVVTYVPLPQERPIVPPVQVPVTRHPTTHQTRPVRQDPVTAPADPPVIVDGGTEQAVAIPGPDVPAVDSGPSVAPIAGAHLEYADAPAPRYPREALREGIEGTVLLQVLVGVDGRPLDVQVYRSSGNRQLDAAALGQVLKRWTFRPAMQDGHAVQAIGLVPIAFNLD